MMRVCGFAVVLFAAWVCRVCPAAEPAPAPVAAGSAPPRLVVLVSIDQFRADYLVKYADLFGEDGFRRLQREGAWFTQCRHGHALSETGPGHAVLATGAWGRRNGIVSNAWFDGRAGVPVYCVEDPASPEIPAAPPADKPEPKDTPKTDPKDAPKTDPKTSPKPAGPKYPVNTGAHKYKGVSPKNLIAATLGDQLKIATAGKARVISLSLKDRAAILMGGHTADGAYWFDTSNGKFTTSTFYRKELPAWVRTFNSECPADAWKGKTWERLLAESAYAGLRADAAAFEKPLAKMGNAFPHRLPMPAEGSDPKKRVLHSDYYKALMTTPFGNDLLLALTKRAVEHEALGADAVPDLLAISLSANDYCGHSWGPYSHEVLDMTVRTDRQIADLLNFLDARVGAGRYVLALSADHGCCPMPAYAKSLGLTAGHADPEGVAAAAEAALVNAFGGHPDRPWVIATGDWALYLNLPLLAEKRVDRAAAEKVAAEALAALPETAAVFTRSRLAEVPAGRDAGDAWEVFWSRDFHPLRSGDVCVSFRPFFTWNARYPSNHGTVYEEDQHVPLLFFGTGVKPGRHDGRVYAVDLAPTLAALLGISPPAAADGRVLRAAVK